MPVISIVIPVKNGEPWLDELFTRLKRQTLADQTEVICIDSGSTDDSVSIINNHNVALIEITPEEFNHGLTRNLGCQAARGQFVVMTVQDALPADDRWLEKLLEGFIDDRVAGVCGQQIVPHDKDKNPVQWFRPVSEPKIEAWEFESPALFDALTPEQKKQICGWDDVTACYRREALLKVPFREISFAEDAAWAMDALRAGYKIVYNKAARVYHYHHEEPDFAFRRTLTVCYHRYKLFDFIPCRPRFSLRRKISMAKFLLIADVPLRQKVSWWRYNLNQHNAASSATAAFLEVLAKGEDSIELLHEKYCQLAPLARSAKS